MNYWLVEVGEPGRHGGSFTVTRTVLFVLPDGMPQPPSSGHVESLARLYIIVEAYEEILRVTQPSVVEFNIETHQVFVPVPTGDQSATVEAQ